MRPADPDLAALSGHIGFLLRQRLLLGLALGLDHALVQLANAPLMRGEAHLGEGIAERPLSMEQLRPILEKAFRGELPEREEAA